MKKLNSKLRRYAPDEVEYGLFGTLGRVTLQYGLFSTLEQVTLRQSVQYGYYIRDFMPFLDTCKLEKVAIKTEGTLPQIWSSMAFLALRSK